MAVVSGNILKSEPIPQHLYTPKKLELDKADLRLYTPDPQEPDLKELDLEYPDPDEMFFRVPLYTPDPIQEKVSTPLYTPRPENAKFREFLTLPNPELLKVEIDVEPPNPDEIPADIDIIAPDPLEILADIEVTPPDLSGVEINVDVTLPELIGTELDVSVLPPDLGLSLFDLTLYNAFKLETPYIPSYAYDLGLSKLKENPFDHYILIPNPINYWVLDLSSDGPDQDGMQGKDAEWQAKWQEIVNQYSTSWADDEKLYLSAIIPHNIERYNSQGKEIKVNYVIPAIRIPKYPLYRGAYFRKKSSFVPNPDWEWPFPIDYAPDPNFKVPKVTVVTQGWGADAQAARNQQFLDEFTDFFSAENFANIGLQAAKSFGKDLLGMMMTTGGNGDTPRPNVTATNDLDTEDILIPQDSLKGAKKREYRIAKKLNIAHAPPYELLYGDETKSGFEWESTPVYTIDLGPHFFHYDTPADTDKTNHSWNVESQKKFNYDNLSFSNHPISIMNSIGPDFMKHKFDAYFVFYNADGTPEGVDLSKEAAFTPFQKFIYNHKGFAVRFGTITLPTVTKEEYNISWLETKINKIRTTLTTENKASMSIRMDQNLFWLDLADKLAGHNNTLNQLQWLSSTVGNTSYDGKIVNPYYVKDNEGDPRQDYAQSWRDSIKYCSNSYLVSAQKKLCLVVKMTQISNFVHEYSSEEILPHFIFDDIRILGTSDSITYEREGSAILNLNVNFIFKFVYEIYNDDLNYGYQHYKPLTENGFISEPPPKSPLDRYYSDFRIKGPIYTYENEIQINEGTL